MRRSGTNSSVPPGAAGTGRALLTDAAALLLLQPFDLALQLFDGLLQPGELVRELLDGRSANFDFLLLQLHPRPGSLAGGEGNALDELLVALAHEVDLIHSRLQLLPFDAIVRKRRAVELS